MGTFITEDPEKVISLRYEMAKKQIETFVDGMRQIGFSKKEMISFLEMINSTDQEENK